MGRARARGVRRLAADPVRSDSSRQLVRWHRAVPHIASDHLPLVAAPGQGTAIFFHRDFDGVVSAAMLYRLMPRNGGMVYLEPVEHIGGDVNTAIRRAVGAPLNPKENS